MKTISIFRYHLPIKYRKEMHMDMNKRDDIKKRFQALAPDHNFHRLGTVFKTREKMYFYDTGTGKVFECDEDEYNFLQYIFENDKLPENSEKTYGVCEKIIELIEKENILQAPNVTEFVQLSDENLSILLEQDLQQIILELTQKCNLRCKYCIYNEYNPAYRNFESKDMEWDVAKRAIDYTRLHSGKKVAVTFYGGEPLVNFKLMKQCMEYSQEIMADRELSYSFSTNLTLMTPEIAQYVASVKGCSVLCSLDGPKEIHDSYRINVNGDGTFAKAIQGLKYLVEAMGNSAKERIIINTVVCPPYSKEKLDMIQTFFEGLEWLPKEIEKKCDYVEGGTLREEDIAVDFLNGKDKYERYQKNELDSIRSWALDNMLEGTDEQGYSAGVNKDNLVKIHNRVLRDKPNGRIGRNGCCIPGNRRIYVQVDGTFLACEKMGDSPSFGDVYNGIDKEKIKQFYIKEYDEKSIEKCKDCWAVNMCSICYATCYCKTGINMESKDIACEYERKQAKGELMAYYQLLEECPDEIRKIKDIPVF